MAPIDEPWLDDFHSIRQVEKSTGSKVVEDQNENLLVLQKIESGCNE